MPMAEHSAGAPSFQIVSTGWMRSLISSESDAEDLFSTIDAES